MSLGLMILAAAIAYGVSIVAIRGAQYIDSNLFGVIVNTIGTLVPLSLLLIGLRQKQLAHLSSKGIIYAVVGGLAIGTFIVLITKIFSSGQNLSYVSPLVWGGGILFATLAGVMLFNEKVDHWSSLGVFAVTSGILLIAYSSYLQGVTK